MSWFFWRRWRDLNPRTPCGAYRISNYMNKESLGDIRTI